MINRNTVPSYMEQTECKNRGIILPAFDRTFSQTDYRYEKRKSMSLVVHGSEFSPTHMTIIVKIVVGTL